ncbi:MAG: HAD-IB family phosphatase [Bacteroidota bacterium]|nr:HAD-IB family phosphatase [Bacteroidota bacterium]|tara:strand:- start:9687 stop:10331 length:645 start_codon:yes stop_codon:yes gene_type:complete
MNHFIIDYDSTFIKVESLDELSKISNGDDETINNKISEITNLGMEGKISFSDSLRKRIELIECNKEDIVKTVEILEKKVSDSFKNNISFLKNNAENILIVSSGFHELIEPIVIKYGIKKENIFANKFLYDNDKVIGYDKKNPLSKSQGKVNILKELKLKGEVHVIGDGYTDYEIKKEGLANYFYLFIENIKRESVVKSADYLLKSLDQFIKIIK